LIAAAAFLTCFWFHGIVPASIGILSVFEPVAALTATVLWISSMRIKLTCGSELVFSDWAGEPLPTVARLLDRARSIHPHLAGGWCNASGQLRQSLAVFVNGEHIRYRQGLQTELKDGDEVYVIPLIAGG
jgi:molybdopterin synthase sulfur carrier subunit